MAQKTKTKQITIVDEKGTFGVFLKMFQGSKKDYDFNGLALLRSLLSNEKARILHIVKTKNPQSVYSLAKLLQRDFKSVSEDVKLLEKFGFIDLIAEKTGKRNRFKPIVILDSLTLEIKI